MSSIMDKGKLPAKMFLRSNSFQKLCSLAHPMRLRGFKSNREALKSVFESLIVTTRGVIQSVTYRILCFLFLTPFTRLVGRPLQGIVAAVATSTSTKDGDSKDRLNTVRLILKLTLSMIVSTDKPTDASCDDNEAKLSEDVDHKEEDAECPRPTATTVTDSAVQTDLPAEPEPEFFDCKEPTEPRPKTCRFLETQLSQRPRRPRRAPTRLALTAVYGCVLGCALQLSTLVYLLSGDAVRFPPGLIFLILALAYIGYVMMRIFTTSDDDRRKVATPANKGAVDGGGTTSKALVPVPEGAITKKHQQQQPKGLHPIMAAVSKRIVATLLQFQQPQKSVPSDLRPGPRMSRSRTRMLLSADDKTISKVKIL